MRATTWVGAAANLGVFALVLLLVRQTQVSVKRTQAASATTDGELKDSTAPLGSSLNGPGRSKKAKQKQLSDETESQRESVYPRVIGLMGISGAISFCCEIVFTRMLGHLLGGSVYAFASMLSGFLLGISLGGAIASRWAQTRRIAAVGFIYAQVGAAVCTLWPIISSNR